MIAPGPDPGDLRPNPGWASLPLFDRKGWRRVRFGDVVKNVKETERDPEGAGIERFIGLEHLEPGSLQIRTWGNVADGTTFTRRCRPGQVLFGKRRAYQRKVAVAEFDAVVSGDIYVFMPADNRLLPGLLPFICLSERFFQYAVETSAGSLSPRTNWKHLAEFEFDLPPLEQQRRIAEVLWAVDEVKTCFLDTHKKFRRYQDACTNEKLVAAPYPSKILGELSSTGNLNIQTGPFGTVLKASSYVQAGTPIINPVNMIDCRLVTENGPFLSDEECERLSRYKMKPGDIILGRKGDVGRAVLVKPEHAGFIVGSDLIRLRLLDADILSEYLYNFFLAPKTQSWITRHASGTTMPGINEKLIQRISISIPPKIQQSKMIEEFRRINTVKEALMDNISTTSAMLLSLTNHFTMES